MLLGLVMRKKLLEVIDVSLRLMVELLVQQRILLLKCRNLCLNLNLGTVGMMDHFHKTVLEVLLVEAVMR